MNKKPLQMKTMSDKKAIRYKKAVCFLVVAFLIFECIMLSGCNVEKRIQRKEDNAVDLVNTKPRLQERVVGPYWDAHPRDTNPKIIISPPKTITVHVPQLIRDTSGRQAMIDSIKNAHERDIDPGKIAADAYDLGWDECEKKYLANTLKVQCPPDTTKQYTLTAEMNRWKDSANKKDKDLSFKNGESKEKDATIKRLERSIVVRDVIAGILLALLLLSAFFNVKGLISKIPIPSILKMNK